jgi:hypothetical protein
MPMLFKGIVKMNRFGFHHLHRINKIVNGHCFGFPSG